MKKILNIFASISLVTTGISSVVACGSNSTYSSNDQKLVNDVVNRIKDKFFAVNEDNQGDLNFGSYSKQFLKEVKEPLANNEQNLVSFANSENQKPINAEKPTNINLHIQSHKIYQDIDIPVKLNYDAQSIANAIAGKTITVLQSGVYKASESASKYTTEIKQQINNLLTPVEQQSDYQISGWENATIYWPKWDQEPNQPIPLNIQIGGDKKNASITLEFQYYQQKKVLDNPNISCPSIPTGIADFTAKEYTDPVKVE